MQFRMFLESISPDTLKWWSNYSKYKTFSTEQEAREWVFQRREFADKQTSAQIFGIDGPEKNRQFANEIPIYKSGKSYKIGKRIRNDNRFRLMHLTVKKPSLYEINMVAQANGESDYKIHPVKWIPLRKILPENDSWYSYGNELQRIKDLANDIKRNKWIEAIIYDVKGNFVIEGQHRSRSLKLLGFNTVPAIGIEYDD